LNKTNTLQNRARKHVPLHERTQHGKQTGRVGSYRAASKL